MDDRLTDHIGWLLWQASQAWTRRFMQALRARGFAGVTLGQVNLMGYLDRHGTVRQNDIAARSGLTKQAVGQFIGELERAGLVERLADPDDGRARLVRYTAKGLSLIAVGDSVKAELENEAAKALPDAAYHALRDSLQVLAARWSDDAGGPR